MQAHEAREPTPLEELWPEVPGGLALAVARMMAKRPQARFGSMAEVAEALAPYVAAASPSFQELRATSAWDGSQLTTAFRGAGRRRRHFALVAGALLALAAVVGVGWLGARSRWFGGPNEVTTAGAGGEGEDEGPKPPTEPRPPKKPAVVADDPNVLTVSQKKEGGGKYRSIAEALDKVRPHQTIRIVDKEVYREDVKLNLMARHEGVALEAPAGAVLEPPAQAINLITISNVRGVTLRDLRLRDRIFVMGKCSGVVIERVEVRPAPGNRAVGVELYGIPAGAEGGPNVLVRDCRFVKTTIGARLSGASCDGRAYGAAAPIHGVAFRNNHFLDCEWGVHLLGDLRRVQVVGNTFQGCATNVLEVEHLLEQSRDVLVANNTAADCGPFLRAWDEKGRGRGARICNNMSLGGAYPDVLAFDSGGHPDPLAWAGGVAPGKPSRQAGLLASRWSFSHNWREVKHPATPPAEPDGWVPPGKLVKVKEKIDVERDPRSPDFLRPKKGSPLATQGAGQVDPTLPSYVGAVPPEGVEPWDWERAWRMPKGAALLTVSKPGGGGEYPSIGEALEKARPWATIRVLDAETYDETIRIDDAEKHTGLTLEAPQGATLRLVGSAQRVLMIRDVPHICVRGFTLSDDGAGKGVPRRLVEVRGQASGIVLDRLRLTPRQPLFAIVILNAAAIPGQPPLQVKGCIIRPTHPRSLDGISVISTDRGNPTQGVLLHGNQMHHCERGVLLSGFLRDVHAVGNVVVSSTLGLQVENLAPASRGLLLANNTVFASPISLRVWDDLPALEHRAGQVEVVNNLFFEPDGPDMCFTQAPRGGPNRPGDGKALFRLWRFHHNCRDFTEPEAGGSLPAWEGDVTFRRADLLAVDADNPRLTRPRKSSPLATQGAGAKDDLPAYIGALPPEGEPAWDWARTWRARRSR
jgi:hypothetical protein